MMQRARAIAVFAILLGGCQSTGEPRGASVAVGQLGNGGFAFTCDDSVACDRYSNTAKTFPDAIALSSKFRIRFVPKSGASSTGITVGTVGETFISPGVSALTAQQAGWGTVVARNAAGAIVEFVTVPILKPDALVVYDAAYSGDAPTKITTLSMKVGEVKSLRALARAKQYDLAGTLQYEWTTPADGVVQINPDATGKVAVSAAKIGTTRLTVAGGTFDEDLSVQVTQ